VISVEEALDRILARVAPLGAEMVLLDQALGRALAAPVVAERRLPPWDNSAMDGYAVRASEVRAGEPLPLVAAIGAGHAPPPLPPGHAARVMTGAPIPDGADAVVMREDADERDGPERANVRFSIAPPVGAHVRRAGGDVEPGAAVLLAGDGVGAGEIGLLAGLGRTLLAVHRRPRAAIVSTGDELADPDRAPGPGQIAGSNAWALAAQCREAGALPTVLPIARDDRAVIRAAFEEALRADVVISSGGVSVGDFDFVKEALSDLGVRQEFWKVAMKPGKPVTFGVYEGAGAGRPVFGLPGNPASSMVGFELFVRPALRRMGGHRATLRPRAPVVLDEPYRHEGKRRHYVRASARRDGQLLRARPNTRQGSGMLRSMVGVNALLEIAEGSGLLAAGSSVTALLLEAL
jgi:molybdopterin molybdotransferase